MTNSWPAAGDNGLTEAQWVSAAAIGDGIVEDFHAGSISGASITLNNATNEVTLSDHRCRVAGYVGDSEGPVTLSVPAVVSNTTYKIAWCYDPALNVPDGGGDRSALGPMRLIVEDSALDTTGGKRYCVLYTIVRTAAQVLTASARAEHRRWVGSALTMPTFVTPVVELPRGTQIFETSTGSTYLRTVNVAGTALEWQNVSAPAGVALPLASGLVAVDTPPQVVREPGGWVSLRGTIRRTTSAALVGMTLGTVPAGSRPPALVRSLVVAVSGGNQGFAVVNINTAGTLALYDPAGGFPAAPVYVQLDNVRFRTS